MIIVMNRSSKEEINRVLKKVCEQKLEAHCLYKSDKLIITAVGDMIGCNAEYFKRLPGVEKVISILTPYKLVSRDFRREDSIVKVGAVAFGGTSVPIIAGPCAVESYEQLKESAVAVRKAGATILRGGAYKPRTSPYSFQGLEIEGLRILHTVAQETGLPVVSEVTDPRSVERMADYVDMLQIGTRNMQNFVLLKEVAKTSKPVLLKRGLASTIEEWLMAAEYIMSGGNERIILCERGIRTFEPYTRNTLDLNAVPLVKQLSHLPVIVDPSHGTGNWKLVGPMARAAVAAGADGLIIEVHPRPEEAISDGQQSLTPNNFMQLMKELSAIAGVLNREITCG